MKSTSAENARVKLQLKSFLRETDPEMDNLSVINTQFSQSFSEFRDFLETLLHEGTIYPWNLADPEVEAYFALLEGDFSLTSQSETEVASRTETLFSKMHQSFRSVS